MTENHCIIDLDREPCIAWAGQVNDELENLTETSSKALERWKKQSIYRVPSSVTNLCKEAYKAQTVCKEAYKPQMLSIGPYHHGEEQLEAMDEHKNRALLHFLKRSGKPLQCYINALAPVVKDLRDAYDQLDEKWIQDDVEFLKLMIVDGCFILELLRIISNVESSESNGINTYPEKDPVFSKHGKLHIVPYLKRDMLMLENQLPMLVLTTLLRAENSVPTAKEGEVNLLILKFFSQPHDDATINELGNCFHILDAYRKSLILGVSPPTTKSSCLCFPPQAKDDQYIRSATELDEAGIRFKKSKTRSLKDISFNRGVLELPLIVVDDALESLYLNLMAFERFHVDAGNEVTSYVFFMDNIIDSVRDVSLLHSHGIIQNALGSDKNVANLFNTLSKDITLDPDSSLGIVHKQVSEYCRKPWPRWKASLTHDYFTNPWTGISVVAAIVLFVLTGIQTAYSVLSYDANK